MADRDHAVQLAGNIMIALAQPLSIFIQLQQLRLKLGAGVLNGAGAYHHQKACVLKPQRSMSIPVVPPRFIIREEPCRIDDVVVVVDIVEEILHNGICKYPISLPASDTRA